MEGDHPLDRVTSPIVHTPIEVPDEVPVEEHEPPGLHDAGLHRLQSPATLNPAMVLHEVHEEEHESPGLHDEDLHQHRINSSAPSAGDGDEEAQEYHPASRPVSLQSKAVSVKIIPRSQRSGLLGRFTILYEAEEPKDYPRKIKWFITLWIALAAVTAPMGSSIILPALPEITADFQTTPFVANLSVAFYMLSMSIFPLWWSSFSETAGRRAVYITSFTAYTIFNIIAAKSTSIGMFIALRILSGGTSAAVQAVGAGTVADIWEVKERGRGMGIFYIGPLCGPLFAPIIGGALTAGLGWRSTQWFQVIYGGLMVLGILLFLPETHHITPIVDEDDLPIGDGPADPEKRSSSRPPLTRISSRKSVTQSVAKKTRKWVLVLHRLFIEPLKITQYLRFPPVVLTIFYASIAFGCLYFLNISVEYTFSNPPYSFSTIEVGLLYIPNSVGYLVTSLFGGRWVDQIMAREARKAGRLDARGRPIFRPEDRLRENAWIGAMLMPAALLWYGWTSRYHVFWLAPILANFFYGVGSMLIFGAATTMLTEFMPKKASNGVALNNFSRNIFSFLGTLLAEPAIRGIGNGWLFTILAIVAFLSSGVILAMKRWGKKWRDQMDREMD